MDETGNGRGDQATEFLYRFRSARALLEGFEELERQEIFFAAPEELNDPLEGFTNIVWHGDAILWRNLLRHYLLCLLDAAFQVFVLGPEFQSAACIPRVRMTDEDLPEAPIRDIYAAICRTFLEQEEPALFIAEADRLGLRLGREGLQSYLRLLQPVAIQTVLCALADQGLPVFKPGADLESPPHRMTDYMRAMLEAHAALGTNAEVVLAIGEKIGGELALIEDYNRGNNASFAGLHFLWWKFPQAYIERLHELMFPSWYTACFVEAPVNAAMWGVYGDSHRGACLQFRTTRNEQGKRVLSLSSDYAGPDGEARPNASQLALGFEPVRYADHYPEIDFFTMLGTLSRSKLAAFWYSDGKGKRSTKAERILSGSAEWRDGYWASHAHANTTKLSHWAHEAEQRLVLTGVFEPTSRKLRYRADDLVGIVFGMKMADADKLAIMRIVERKLSPEQRRHFTFYQARFSYENKRLEHVPLGLLSPQS